MSIKPSIYSVATIQSGDGRSADIRLGVTSIDYYEDVMCPTVSCKIQVTNVAGMVGDDSGRVTSLYDGLKLRGGEAVYLRIEANSPYNEVLDFNSKPLYVKGVNNVVRKAQKEAFELSLVSLEAMENEVVFLKKAYPKETPISDHVTNIVSESFTSPGPFTPDRTSNATGFLGNQMHPFQMLTRLASRSVSGTSGVTGGTAGFFFFQTRDGLQFKAIDSLVNAAPKARYFYTEVNQSSVDFHGSSDLTSNDRKIINYTVERNQDLIGNLKKGAYSVTRNFYNPYTQAITGTALDFIGGNYLSALQGLTGVVDDLVSSGLQLTGAAESFTELPSQIITEVFDLGTVSKGVDNSFNSDPTEYVAQRKMRYNTLFTQIITIMVPLNTKLRAGDVIDCEFPEISFGKNRRVDKQQISGLYMIKELNHHFDTRASYTSMRIVRDSYGRK